MPSAPHLRKTLSQVWSSARKHISASQKSHPADPSSDEDECPIQDLPQVPMRVMECPDGSLTPDEYKQSVVEVLMAAKEDVERDMRTMFGFPMNLTNEYSALDFLGSAKLNNIGDPFVRQNKWGNSRAFELGVLDWFASLWEIGKPDYWGYLTSGGTESIMHGLYAAREAHTDGIVYASEDTHYSVYKLAHVLRMPLRTVPSLENGEIDYAQLKKLLSKNSGRSAIIVANIGTTLKGGIDNIEKIVEALKKAGYPKRKFYIHCDAALFGVMLPFTQIPCKLSFEHPIDSISASGHKFLGCPPPCGVFICRKSHRRIIGNSEIIKSPDTTIAGSRNGHAPMYMWYALSVKGRAGIAQDVKTCLENAKLLCQLLILSGIDAKRNPYSNIVVFDKPKRREVIDRWHLACVGPSAHVIVMPHMSKTHVEKLASDLEHCQSLCSLMD